MASQSDNLFNSLSVEYPGKFCTQLIWHSHLPELKYQWEILIYNLRLSWDKKRAYIFFGAKFRYIINLRISAGWFEEQKAIV